MIPILYERTEEQFVSNGLGRLSDCIKCIVTEQKNGIYECEFQYPVTGIHYSDIQEGRVISCTVDDTQARQAFDIYSRSAPINGIVTFYARHISYRLRNVIVKPHTSQTVAQALANLSTYSVNENPFTFWTDKSTVAVFKVDYPKSIKECLLGSEGSILDVYGGEFEYDNLTVKLYNERGADKSASVALRGGKNITSITQKLDAGETYTAVVPYWLSRSDDTIVTLTEGYVTVQNAPGYIKPVPLDLSDHWETAPTEAQLREEAVRRLTAAEPWVIKENVEVNFVALWQTDEYASVAPLQRVRLCDKVSVVYPELGINVVKQVIKTTYNVLLDRYEKIELGDNVRSLSSVYKSDIQEAVKKEVPSKTAMQNAINYATQLISGGLGGHVVFKQNAAGEPEEILVMDTGDISTAVNVLRINYQGIAFSREGYDPSKFTTAWTIDGHFVADFIDTGNLNANVIKTGILMDAKNKNYWNLDTGEISISFDPGSGAAVTQADLQRVETAAQNMANSAESNAKSYTDSATNSLSGSINATIQGLTTSFASTYATKTELNEAKVGNINLQIPYEYGNGFVSFEAKVYGGVEDITSHYANNLFEWFVKSEAQDGLTPIGVGKSINVDITDAKFGKTVVCRFTAVDDPRYWTDHNGNIITDHAGNPLGFVALYAQLAAEATVYQRGYTEGRFSNLELTAENFAVELESKLGEAQTQSLIDAKAEEITLSVATAYSTKEELTQAIHGNVTLQTPYVYESGVARFRAVVYRGIDDVTGEYPAGLFRWYLRREDIDDRELLGTGKQINVATSTARYGMTVVCEFRFLGDPEPWTDHAGNEVTDHNGNVFYFRQVKAVLENETNLYQKNYTESRFAALTISDEEIRSEVAARTEEMVAAIEAEKQRAEGQEASLSEANQNNAAAIADEVLRAQGVEGDIQDAVATNAHNIEEAYSRITQTSNAITAEVSRAQTQEQTIIASVNAVDGRVSATNESLADEVARATGAESTINGTLANHADTLSQHGEDIADAAEQIEINVREIETAKTSITQTSNGLTAEITRAKDVEATLKTQGDGNASAINSLSERVETAETQITANSEGLSLEVSRAKGVESGLIQQITAVDEKTNVGENLFVMGTALVDYFVRSDGNVYEVERDSDKRDYNYITSDFIPVSGSTKYYLQIWSKGNSNAPTYYFAQYDANKAIIDYSYSINGTKNYTKAEMTTLANARYMRVCVFCWKSDRDSVYIKFEQGGATAYSASPREARASKSSLVVTARGINSTVSEKVGKDEVISTINQTAEQITIQANKINLNGAISGNGNFAIDQEGTMVAKNAVFEEVVYGAYIRGGSLITDTEEGARYISVDGDKVKANTDNDYLTSIQKSLFVDVLGYGWVDYGDYGGIDLRSKASCAMNLGSTEVFNVVSNTLGSFTTSAGGDSLPLDEENDYYNRNKKHLNRGANLYTNFHVYGNTYLKGSLSTTGQKNREVLTKNYGRVTLSAYETPTPMFGDIGTGKTDENGEAYISIDDIFAETTSLKIEYCVFLQKEGQGDLWVDAKEIDHFVVKGTPNLSFSWELKAVQRDYEMVRLENMADATADDPTNFEDDTLQSDMDEELSSLDELDRDMEQLVRDYDREVMEMEIRDYENLESVSGN